jgi:hypothetical protein
MRSPSHLVALLLLVCPVTLLAQTDPQTASLGKKLRQGAEPPHRTQAALGLGESDDPEALQPLCEGLKDPSEQVRAAAARALGKLKEVAGLECLKAQKKETDAAARAAIKASIETLQALKDRAPRVYVQFTGVKDKTGALSSALMKATEARMRRKLSQMGALLAPEKENKAEAQGVLRKHGIQGYRLQAEVHPTKAGGLRVMVVCIGYPDQALLGDVELQASGAKPEDLLKALAPRIIEEAADTFEWDT